MNGKKEQFVRLVADALKSERFALVDIGCSGGLETVWREFGDRFAAVGFDASVSECRRLAAQETNPSVRYVPGFVDIPPDHPFALRDGPEWAGTPGSFYHETSSRWTMEIRAAHLDSASLEEKLRHNQWQTTELADPKKPIYAPRALAELGYTDVDFLKIDVDGPDFRILNSFDGLFGQLGILAVRLEVMMFGGPGDTVNTFHNTDRFMRQQGYELVRLDTYVYSKRALPARYRHSTPSITVTGRLYQGEAHYALLPRADDGILSPEKLIKLAAIFSVWDQPDGAAEILLTFRDQIAPLLDVDAALDLLAAQTQAYVGVQQPLSYRDYTALFATDSPYFFPPAPSTPEPPFSNETLDAVKGDWLPDTFLVMPRLQEGASVRALACGSPEPISLVDLTIDTKTVPYAYSMVWKLDTMALPPRELDSSIVVEVSVDVGAGRLSILWVDEEYQALDESERFVLVDPHRQRVLVTAPSARARHLVFRNSAREGLATSFVVRRLRGKIG